MIVYVETNFLIELAFSQEEHAEAQALLRLAKSSGKVDLALPAYSVGEAYEASERKWRERRALLERVRLEIGQMRRSEQYIALAEELEHSMTRLLVGSGEEQRRRLEGAINEVLKVARILPLDGDMLDKAVVFQKTRSLEPQDSIVYASVMTDLEKASVPASCFITRDAKDFSTVDIEDKDLKRYKCKLFATFEKGLGYVQAHL